MQPPPRKGNYAKFLKNLHSEQIAKLQAKNQHECDLLEDIRQFTIKRSAVEKSYSEALLKISSAYLNKKIPNIPDIKMDGVSDEKWNMWSVWRTVLEENEKLARARLAAVEVFQQQIADEAKMLRTHKMQISRKIIDQLANIQKELQTCVQDVDKTKKLYFDEEHSAHDVRDKAKDIEEKLKKKKGSFFQSITSLQKNSARVSSRRDALEEKSTGARNDYLLSLAAANAHQIRYFAIDLQSAMTTMEDYVFERVAEYLTLMGRTELMTCAATQHSFGKIRDQAQQLTREYNIMCCHLYYPVLKQHIQYEFEPCDNDAVDHVTVDHESAAQTLSREAKRHAARIARENNAIRECSRRLQVYSAMREGGQKVDPNDQNGPDLETKIDELRQNIRRSETSRAKAEARIECLRAGGVNVDEWVQDAETLLAVQDMPRSASSMSENPSSDSFYDSEAEVEMPQVVIAAPASVPTIVDDPDSSLEDQNDTEVDAMLEQERQRIEQLTAGWDDPTQVDWTAEGFEDAESPAPPSGPTFKCTALYSYTAQNPDELSIVESEQLEVVGEGDGDGWLRARNYRGEEGFVPHNYLDVERDQPAPTASVNLVTQISFSSVDYTVYEQEGEGQEGFPEAAQSPDQVSVISAPVIKTTPELYCCAMYDYDASAPDELTFEEGDVIRIITKSAHGVDDGWWEGEIDGRKGNFPSLVVEECDENGEPLTAMDDETPPDSAPPLCTPPAAPPGAPVTSAFLFNHEVVVTQPTPCADASDPSDVPEKTAPLPSPSTPSPSAENQGFALSKLTSGQQKQYGTQFSEEDVPDVAIPCVVIQDEDEVAARAANDANGGGDFGLGVAQIVITCATPMIEEPEKAFPPIEESEELQEGPADDLKKITEDEEPAEIEEPEPEPEEPDEPSIADDQPTDSAPFPLSSSSPSEGESTGPSTAENSQSHPPPGVVAPATETTEGPLIEPEEELDHPKQVVGGRASIPDELAPHQLARLQGLKESNA